MNFEKQKHAVLSKIDKSKKGSIDDRILDLIQIINSKDNYYTTSSCSGRIVVIRFGKRKNDCEWLFMSHDKAKDIKLRNLDGEVFFRMEGAILHVCCKTLDDAKAFLDASRNAGFKVGGIISLKPKIMAELRSVDFIDTIIAKNGKMVIEESYLKVLLSEANQKLERNWKRIGKLTKELEKI